MSGDVAGASYGEPSKDKEHENNASVEILFAGMPPPPWWRQVTVRSVVASVFLGAMFSFMAMRMGMTIGLVPSFNMAASMVSFFVLNSWTRLLDSCGVPAPAFNRQENVVGQTCVIACSTLAFYGGFMSFLPAMSETVARAAGGPGTRQQRPHAAYEQDRRLQLPRRLQQLVHHAPLDQGHDSGLQVAVLIRFSERRTSQQLPHAKGGGDSDLLLPPFRIINKSYVQIVLLLKLEKHNNKKEAAECRWLLC